MLKLVIRFIAAEHGKQVYAVKNGTVALPWFAPSIEKRG